MPHFYSGDDIKKHGSIITHLLSQVRLGMDLTKVSRFHFSEFWVVPTYDQINLQEFRSLHLTPLVLYIQYVGIVLTNKNIQQGSLVKASFPPLPSPPPLSPRLYILVTE